MKVTVPSNWIEFGIPGLQYAADKPGHVDEAGWWTCLPVYKEENKLIGSGGYKGKPTNEGTEIGYEITSTSISSF